MSKGTLYNVNASERIHQTYNTSADIIRIIVIKRDGTLVHKVIDLLHICHSMNNLSINVNNNLVYEYNDSEE